MSKVGEVALSGIALTERVEPGYWENRGYGVAANAEWARRHHPLWKPEDGETGGEKDGDG
ncbi:hypothetical protein AB0I10_07610 [Streptomyces sp. NPDC050636]|uniref:hypothetical protein n=1 Tax=Streptomyces sp. NPDC050636 TaxID=3154510 RepID=UPI00342E9AB1